MINLIPAQAKRRVRKEYFVRVVTVWMFLSALALAVSAVLLIPTFVLYSRQIPDTQTGDSGREEKEVAIASMRSTLTEANAFAQQLSRSLESVRASEILTHIENAHVEGIVVEGVHVVQEKQVLRIDVSARAATRERLRAFQDALRRDAYFETAEVPISQLAKDTDLSVTLTLTLRAET